MSTCLFHFKKPGMHTTIQDNGRLGYLGQGIPQNGVMDKTAARAANYLVGNRPNSPVLEMTFIGPEVEIIGDCQIAITGADMSAQLNGIALPMYETISIGQGAKLSFGRLKTGCRAYLAIRGEWAIKQWLNSYSATAFDVELLTPDSIIKKGSVLKVKSEDQIDQRIFPKEEQPQYSRTIRIRVLPGPEFEDFSRTTIAYFFSRGYRLTTDSNRMGYRLDDTIIDFRPDREVISSGVIPGTIQITNAGQPIILMADAQTSGGYYRLANVISADIDILAQAKPGDEIWFSLIAPN